MRKVVLLFLLIVGVNFVAKADKVKVRLFVNNRIEWLNVSFDLGEYSLLAGDSVLESVVADGRSVILHSVPGGVSVAVNDLDYGVYPEVRLVASDTACILCLNPTGVKSRTYEGDLVVTAINSTALMIVNDVEFETYIAGVVQSEIYGSNADIFRVQAIISRTWALRNMRKHSADGFNFCDQVHCQAYLNRCVRPDIMLGTIRSMGETIVDAEGKLIETPFHSNSGGQTANSEDVWRAALPYLRSVSDTFSFRMKQSEWTKVIPKEQWLNYFSTKHKLNLKDDSVRHTLLTFSQAERQAKICGVPLTRVRVDFKLKSTFFDVSLDGSTGNVVLHGRGYGHGVGLSQEGTIRMVNLGFSYDSIITHYYLGSHIHKDENLSRDYVNNYAVGIEKIIADDLANPGRVKSKKDDWLGLLFRIHNRNEREEVYEPTKQELEQDWEYEW